MKEINISVWDYIDKQIAEIEVEINGKKRYFNYRVEAFRCKPNDKNWDKRNYKTQERVVKLQRAIGITPNILDEGRS